MKQLPLFEGIPEKDFPELDVKSKNKNKPEEVAVVSSDDTSKSLIEYAINNNLKDNSFESVSPQAIDQRTNAFLLGVHLSRLNTVKKMLDNISTVENIMLNPAYLQEVHPSVLLELYKTLDTRLEKQIDRLKNTKDALKDSAAQNFNFYTQINQGGQEANGSDVALTKESRENIMKFFKTIIPVVKNETFVEGEEVSDK